MITKEDFAVIKALHKRGVYQKDIAAELDLHPRTVRRALKRESAPEKKRKHAAANWILTSRRWTNCSPPGSGMPW